MTNKAILKTGILVWVPKLWCPKNTFQVFFFSCTSIKICEIAINDFTMHQIIFLKLRRRQKCRQKRKTMKQKDIKKKEGIVYKCFYSFKKVIDCTNNCFFFLISLSTCSHSLNDVSIFYCLRFLLYYLLRPFSYSHTNFLFKYMIF